MSREKLSAYETIRPTLVLFGILNLLSAPLAAYNNYTARKSAPRTTEGAVEVDKDKVFDQVERSKGIEVPFKGEYGEGGHQFEIDGTVFYIENSGKNTIKVTADETVDNTPVHKKTSIELDLSQPLSDQLISGIMENPTEVFHDIKQNGLADLATSGSISFKFGSEN